MHGLEVGQFSMEIICLFVDVSSPVSMGAAGTLNVKKWRESYFSTKTSSS